MKFRVSSLSKSELIAAMDEANLTPLQNKIVLALNREDKTDTGIMLDLHLSRNRYYAEKRIALSKMQKAIQK